MSYEHDAIEDAKSTVLEYLDQIIESYFDNGAEASTDLLNDYDNGDSYHHENHVDKSYTLQEAAELLDNLSKYEETDSGLWDGQEPRQAICTQAAFTYGNAVYHYWRELLDVINDDEDLTALFFKYQKLEKEDRDDEVEQEEELASIKGLAKSVIKELVKDY